MSIRNRAISALRWRVVAQMGIQVIIGLSGLLMIRLLRPEDFGLMAGAALLVGLARLTSEMGLSAALVQRPAVEAPLLRQIFGAVLLWNVLLFALLYGAAPLAADWFGFAELTAIIRVLSLQLVFDVFATVPTGLLTRRIDFRELSVIDLWAAVGGSAAGISTALLGMGVWSLVAASLATSVIHSAGVLWVMGPTGLPSFRFAGLMPDLRFGAQVTATAVLTFVNRKVDIFIVGKMLGQEILGAFTVAVDLAKFPTRTIMPAITRVMFPVYARLQDDRPAVKSAFLQSVEMLSLVLFPAFWGLSTVADDALRLLFGDAWSVAGEVLRWLCVAMPVRTVERMLPAVTRGAGREDLTIRNSLVTLGFLVPFLLVGAQGGYVGVAAAWSAAILLSCLVNVHHTLPLVGCSWREVAAAVAPSLFAAAAMAVAVVAVRMAIGDHGGTVFRLAAAVAAGAATYGALMLLFNRAVAIRAWRLAIGSRRE